MSQSSDVDGEMAPARDTLDALLRVVSILRRRWLVVAAVMVVALAGMMLSISMLRPYWEASTTLVLRTSGPTVLDKVQGVNEDEQNNADYKQYYETQRTIVGSRRVAEAALAGLGLATDPTFLGIDDITDEAKRAEAAVGIDPIDRLRDMISVTEVRNSRVLKITVEYPDPDIARDIANAVAGAYLDHVSTKRTDTGELAKVNVAAERVKAKEELQKSERALDAFKEEHEITSISLEDRQSLITQNIQTLSRESKEAEVRRIELEAMLRQAKLLRDEKSLAAAALLDPGDRMGFEGLLAERLIAEREFAELSVKYEEKHPQYLRSRERLTLVESRLERSATEMLRSLRARHAAAAESETQLGRSLEAERLRALELSRLEPRYRELEREARTGAGTYELIAKRDAEIGMTNRVESAPVEVLDEATAATDPVRPRKLLLMAVALLVGVGLGCGLAIAVDFRDHRIRGLPDLERAIAGFGLPALGQLPLLPTDPRLGVANARAQRRQRDLYTHLFPQSLMAERCRGIRTALTFSLAREGGIVLLVTSPSSSEGKSSTALNLALSFCQAKKRVMLVDADMRRPRLQQVFPPPVDQDHSGLSWILAGRSTLAETVDDHADGAPDLLSVLRCGEIPATPAELLDAPAARKLMQEMRNAYDVVVIDSPPILPVIDPLILARLVDGVILVTKCQATTRADLTRALAILRQGDTNLLGVVLNEVDVRSDGYGYASEYYTYRAAEPSAVEAG